MPSAHGIVIEIIGDEKSYLRSVDSVLSSNTKMEASFKQVGVSANLSADAQIRAALKSQEALKANAAALSSRAATLPSGSREQAAATLLAAEANAKYSRSLGLSVSKSQEAEGVFGRLGKSVSFVSKGFLGATIGADLAFKAITDAENLAAAQRSLGVAIQRTGGDLEKLRPEYDATARAAAQFGVDQVTATQGLARATLLTGDAEKAQRAYQEALVISKAIGKDFNTTLTATARGQEGITTSLRRYGIILDTTATGQEQFDQVMQRFAGQAEANTTPIDKLSASLTNLGTAIGQDITPTLGPLIDDLTKLLGVVQKLHNVQGGISNALGPFGFLLKNPLQLELDAIKKIAQGPGGGGSSSSPTSGSGSAGPPGAAGPPNLSQIVSSGKVVPAFTLNMAEQIAQAQAALTKSGQDDVAAARQVVAKIKGLISSGKLKGSRLIQALGLEASALSTIWAAEDAAAQKRAAAAQAAQAKIEAQIQDSIDPLRLEVALSRAQALGKPLTAILKKLRKSAEDALKSGRLSLEQQREAWDQITSLNQQLASQSSASAKQIQQANTRLLTAGLGLSDAQRAELRARLSHLDARGRVNRDGVGAYGYEIGRNGRPIHVHTSVNLDGRRVASNTTKHQERRQRRNSSQRRGPNAGD